MQPINKNNFIFNINEYNRIFSPLKNISPKDYSFVMNLVTIGADIKRSTKPPPISNPNYPINNPLLTIKVTQKFLKHLNDGHFRGPYKLDELPSLFDKIHTSPIAAKFKNTGKVMILVDASAPKNHNINSEILQIHKTTKYSTFQHLCWLLIRIGPYGWIWVVDAVDAYYRIPIQKKFQHLFGIFWLGRILIYKCLSFGLSTAPSIYNQFADLLVWACIYYKRKEFLDKNTKLFNILHYLDDFFGGHKNKKVALAQMKFLVNLMKLLNIPTNNSKVVGPSQSADILGWSCKTVPRLLIGLKEIKRIKYSIQIKLLLNSEFALIAHFEKINGYIRHTINIFPLGNKFIRNIEHQKYKFLSLIEKNEWNKNKKFLISKGSKFELQFWLTIFTDIKFKYVELEYLVNLNKLPIINIWTDASTSYGAGGISSKNNLYHIPWSSLNIKKNNSFINRFKFDFQDHIVYLELLAIVIMAYLYAHNWKNKFIKIFCDNSAAVAAINTGCINFSSKLYHPKANLVILFARLALKFQFYFEAIHINGNKNPIADALSRKDDLKRNIIYNHLNKNINIPSSIVSKIINLTCIDKFSLCPCP